VFWKLQRRQNLSGFNIAVILMIARNNTLEDLHPLIAVVLIPKHHPGIS
jgi:hypothetical protein